MKSKLLHTISELEEKWFPNLLPFLEKLFSTAFVPSHDHTHHLRTWKAAKLIMLEISDFDISLPSEFVEAVLLASMFHDTGIIETRGEAHGAKGSKIYLKYISEHCNKVPVMHKEIAHVINIHDLKKVNQFIPFHWDKQPDLLTLVSISDDMDAMGIIGIYRYAEIYLQRGTPMKSLGMVLLENVSIRYNNISKASSLIPTLIKITKPKYKELITFYDNYNQQLLTESDPETVYSGHIGIINYIRNFSVIGKFNPLDYPSALENFLVGKYVTDFFTSLREQLIIGNRQ